MDINKSMSKLSKLTKTQLDKMLLDTQAELSRREGVTKAEKEIRAILKKYSINIGDIDLAALRPSADGSRKGKAGAKKKAKRAGGKDNRASVAAKFKSLDGSETWTGRGRAPKWVVSQCESEGMSVEAFKEDARFLIT
jgi:DNA-binding protein H-NS